MNIKENTPVECCNGEILIYPDLDGKMRVELNPKNENVWMTTGQIAQLFRTSEVSISETIQKIFEEGELEEAFAARTFPTEDDDGESNDNVCYNLDMIIALALRINSPTAMAFRCWAEDCLKEYLLKGFAMDDKRLKNLGDSIYWAEMRDRIKYIRFAKKVYDEDLRKYITDGKKIPCDFQVPGFFRCSRNDLFKTVCGVDEANLIYQRVNADDPFLGLKRFDGNFPTLTEVQDAQNYLTEAEQKKLNELVCDFFDRVDAKAREFHFLSVDECSQLLKEVVAKSDISVEKCPCWATASLAVLKTAEEYVLHQLRRCTDINYDDLETVRSIWKSSRESLYFPDAGE